MKPIRQRFAVMRSLVISEAESAAIARADAERERSKAARRRRELAAHRPDEPFTEAFRRVNQSRFEKYKKQQRTSLFAPQTQRSDAKSPLKLEVCSRKTPQKSPLGNVLTQCPIVAETPRQPA